MDDVKHLDVRLNRLRRWHTDGLLCIGDAAHAMSPVGGVGINLAVQDAVAAARLLAGPLRRGAVTAATWPPSAPPLVPTAVTQALQRQIDKRLLGLIVRGEEIGGSAGTAGPAGRTLPMAHGHSRLPGRRWRPTRTRTGVRPQNTCGWQLRPTKVIPHQDDDSDPADMPEC